MSWLLCSLIRNIEAKRMAGGNDICRGTLWADLHILWALCFFEAYLSVCIGLYQRVDFITFLCLWILFILGAQYLSAYFKKPQAVTPFTEGGFVLRAFPEPAPESTDWADEVMQRLEIDLRDPFIDEDGQEKNPDHYFCISEQVCINRQMLKAVIRNGKRYYIQLHAPYEEMEIEVCPARSAAFWNWYNRLPMESSRLALPV